MAVSTAYVGNFVDALQCLTMHWNTLMQHVHYDALQWKSKVCNAHCNPGSNQHWNAGSVANQKHFPPPLSLGDDLDMRTFQSYISTSTIYYIITLNLLLRGIEPTVVRGKGDDITTTLKGLLLAVLLHVHTTSLGAFLGLRVFFTSLSIGDSYLLSWNTKIVASILKWIRSGYIFTGYAFILKTQEA